jgi:hypothetical protein
MDVVDARKCARSHFICSEEVRDVRASVVRTSVAGAAFFEWTKVFYILRILDMYLAVVCE